MLGTLERRSTRRETLERVRQAPRFSTDWVPDVIVDALATAYREITGARSVSRGQRNMLAACHRVHGDDTVALLRDMFRSRGTTTNLLLDVRTAARRTDGQSPAAAPFHRPPDVRAMPAAHAPPQAPRPTGSVADPQVGSTADRSGCGCPIERLLDGLVYCAEHAPAFRLGSDARYDRRPLAVAGAPAGTNEPLAGNHAGSTQGTEGLELVSAAYRVFKDDLTPASRVAVLAVLRRPRVAGRLAAVR